MEHLRTRWAALVVALLLLISVAGVAAAGYVTLPTGAAQQAEEQVDDDQGQDEDQDEDQDETVDEDADEDADTDDESTTEQPTDPTTADTTAGAQGEHGALVSAVAKNKACVGGPHMNHGWAVSQVARGLYVPTAGECPPWTPEVTPAEGATPEADTTGKVKGGKSADHRKNGKHGHGSNRP